MLVQCWASVAYSGQHCLVFVGLCMHAHFICGLTNNPGKHEPFAQCCINVGPPSTTLCQHKYNIGATPRRMCWDISSQIRWEEAVDWCADLNHPETVIDPEMIQFRWSVTGLCKMILKRIIEAYVSWPGVLARNQHRHHCHGNHHDSGILVTWPWWQAMTSTRAK